MPKLHDLVQQTLEEIQSLGRISLAEAVELSIEILRGKRSLSRFSAILIDHFEIVGKDLDPLPRSNRPSNPLEAYKIAEEIVDFYFPQYRTLEINDPER